MKKINTLNKCLAVAALVLLILLVQKIFTYKSWDRYYYTSSVSNPEAFPIHLFGIWFTLENGERSGDFYKDIDKINAFVSDWGVGESYDAYEPEFLPRQLFVEYLDYRSKAYYVDTIDLPMDRLDSLFAQARRRPRTNLSSRRQKGELEFHVGIANSGHIIIWLTDDNYQKELYRTQLFPKPFPKKLISLSHIDTDSIADPAAYIDSLFRDIPDSVKYELKTMPIEGVQYKDSIPLYFDHLQR